jgi:hypothetical protein
VSTMSVTPTAKHAGGRPKPGLRLAAESGLEMLLTDAALEDGGVSRFLKPRAAGRTIAGLARHPHRSLRDAAGLAVELAAVAAGSSELEPAKGDRRFGDRAWRENWLLHRLMQSYLATVDQLIADAGLDWRTERQARFAATSVLDALAPTNFPWSNPAVLKESIDEGARISCAGDGGSCAMSPGRRTFPPASTCRSSRWGGTSRSRRGRSCSAPRCSS